MKRKLLHQDDQSASKKEINGRNSYTGNLHHIDGLYFFVKDRVVSGDIKIVYCPIEMMLVDFFTKPLQGNIFENFCSKLMWNFSLG